MDRAALDLQIDAIDGDESLELLGQPARFENDVVGHACGTNYAAPRRDVGAIIPH